MARLVNDEMPERVAEKIRRAVADIPAPRIVALGATYKKNCEDRRESPAAHIVDILQRDGYDVAHHDPLIEKMGYKSLSSAAKGADLIAVLVCHDAIGRELAEKRKAVEASMRHPRIILFES